MKNDYNRTLFACFTGYVVQAIVNNFVPLLFLMFHVRYGIPLAKITLLVTINFGLQLAVDFISAGFIDKIGYRLSMIMAHALAAAGLLLLTVLPDLFADPFNGLLIAVLIYATGGGLLEVLVSPIVEACPTPNKEKAMSLLHSFYCWGYVGMVLISTLFFTFAGIENWKVLTVLWALIPLVNGILFINVPIASLLAENEKGQTIRDLASCKIFWILMLLMLCAGACEQAVSQWASTFAELGLGVSKTVGDLTGPMFFAVMMGLTRLFYGKYGDRISLDRFILVSAFLCLTAYLLISLSPLPFLSLAGCGLCGMSVGILWPGTFSMAAAAMKRGGTALFAFLALAGDLGCAAGPTFVGFISSAAGDNLKTGILAGTVFPVILILTLVLKRKIRT